MADVKQVEGQGMITLRGSLSDKAFTTVVAAKSGCAIPKSRMITKKADRALAWMSPDELLLLAPAAEASALTETLQASLTSAHALVAEVSNARAVFAISGSDVRDTLARLTPADVQGLAKGELRRTRLAQVAAALWFESDTEARVICFRSVADYMSDLLSRSAKGGAVLV